MPNQNPEVADSQLFGHERGSFTGAYVARKGACEVAGDGSLLLDEIGDASPVLQAKMLRFIEERVFRPIGATKDLPMKARVLAATHVDLVAAMERGTFREDLYHRLACFVVRVPSLRDRREDIPALVRGFARERGNEDAFEQRAIDLLEVMPWPGHVRQLQANVRRMMATIPDRVITADDVRM